MYIYYSCHKQDQVSLTLKSGFVYTNNKQINLLLNTVNELAAAFLTEFRSRSSAPAWWKALEEREIKHYGDSALFVWRWTMEKQLVPVGTVSATAKMPPRLGVHPRARDGARGKKLICSSAFSFWLSCSWCRMAGGDLESCVSCALKQDFAKSGRGQGALCKHPSTTSGTGGEVLPSPQTGRQQLQRRIHSSPSQTQMLLG